MVALIKHKCTWVARAVGGWSGAPFLFWALMLIVFMHSWLGLWDWLWLRTQAESFHHVNFVGTTEPEYALGEDPVTRILVERNRPPDCTLTIYRHVADVKTGVIVFSQFAPGIAENTEPGKPREYKRVIHDANLAAGRCYTYFFDAVDTCRATGSPPPVRSPRSAPFCITPAKPGGAPPGGSPPGPPPLP